MCKLLVVKIENNDTEEVEKLLLAQKETMSMEKHGIAALIVLKDNTVIIERDYNDYERVFSVAFENIKNAKLISLHSRTSTGGSYGLHNTHFFEHNGLAFAHNGYVGKFSDKSYNGWSHEPKDKKGKTEYKDCDSLQLLKHFPETQAERSNMEILNSLVETDFNGAGFLINIENPDENYLMCYKKMYAVKKDDYTAFFSYDPDTTYQLNKKEIWAGVQVVIEGEKEKLVLDDKEIFEGIYNIDLCQNNP